MTRVTFFVDGFNVYHSIQDQIIDQAHPRPRFQRYKWLDLFKLAGCFLTAKDQLTDVYYFSALAKWNQSKVQRHEVYIKALKNSGVIVVMGEFRRKDRMCRRCHRPYKTYEEKETDVSIAVYMMQLAFQNTYDTALVLSGDGDLVPAIRSIKTLFPQKRTTVMIPVAGRAEAMKKAAPSHVKIKERHLQSSLFPQVINPSLSCPPTWR